MPDSSKNVKSRAIRKIRGLGTRERINPEKRARVPVISRGRNGNSDSNSDQNGLAPIRKIYGLGTRERKTPPKRIEGLKRPARPRHAKKPR